MSSDEKKFTSCSPNGTGPRGSTRPVGRYPAVSSSNSSKYTASQATPAFDVLLLMLLLLLFFLFLVLVLVSDAC